MSLIEYPEHLSCIVFTVGCQFRCGYCQNPDLALSRISPIDSKIVLEKIRNKRKYLDGCVITGGEPLLQQDIEDFCRILKNYGYDVMIETNGYFYEKLRNLIENNLVDYVAMDYKAPINKYQRIVNVPIDISRIEAARDLIMKSNIKYEFRTTVAREILSLEDLVQITREIKGADLYIIQNFRNQSVLDPEFKHYKPYTTKELEKIKPYLLENVKNLVIR